MNSAAGEMKDSPHAAKIALFRSCSTEGRRFSAALGKAKIVVSCDHCAALPRSTGRVRRLRIVRGSLPINKCDYRRGCRRARLAQIRLQNPPVRARIHPTIQLRQCHHHQLSSFGMAFGHRDISRVFYHRILKTRAFGR